jgi:hypothetical protein
MARLAVLFRLRNGPGAGMKDMREKVEQLRADAEDCALISKLASDKAKREIFTRLAEHLGQLAKDVEAVIAEKTRSGET